MGKSQRFQKSKTWSADQLVKQATIGHPREYAMSTKLKENIQKFLIEEYMLIEEENAKDEFENDDNNIILMEENGVLERNKNGRNLRHNSELSSRNGSLSDNGIYEDDTRNFEKDTNCYDINDYENGIFYTNGLSSVQEDEGGTSNIRLRRSIDDSLSRTLRVEPNGEPSENVVLGAKDSPTLGKRSHSLPTNFDSSIESMLTKTRGRCTCTRAEVCSTIL